MCAPTSSPQPGERPGVPRVSGRDDGDAERDVARGGQAGEASRYDVAGQDEHGEPALVEGVGGDEDFRPVRQVVGHATWRMLETTAPEPTDAADGLNRGWGAWPDMSEAVYHYYSQLAHDLRQLRHDSIAFPSAPLPSKRLGNRGVPGLLVVSTLMVSRLSGIIAIRSGRWTGRTSRNAGRLLADH